MLLSDVYRMVFKYYGSVLDWKNPDFSGAEKARHLALAAFGAPFSAAGVPLAVTTLNYLKQIFVTKTVGQELLDHWEGQERAELTFGRRRSLRERRPRVSATGARRYACG